MPASLKLVAGLGNPGPRYSNNRHNAGFMLADSLAAKLDAGPWKSWKSLGESTKASTPAGDIWLVKPLTFMNDSGRMVRAFADYHGVAPAQTLVCFDDISLELGRLRIRLSGSGGGHNGMKSVIENMATKDVPRLRMGIGPQPPGMPSEVYVLQNFSSGERETLQSMLGTALDAVLLAAEKGVETAMNRYNGEGA